MQNKLIDLNNHLFTALERVNNEDLEGEKLREEINRARSVANLGREIVQNARVVLEAEKFAAGGLALPRDKSLPAMLDSSKPPLEAVEGGKG